MPTETKQEFAWAKTRLSDVCSKITDGTHHSPINKIEGSFMYVTAKNIRRWGLDLTDITYVSEDVHNEIYSRCPVERGDILYIKDGVTTGIAAINTCSEPFSMLSSVALLKPIKEAIDSRFLKHWLNSPETLKSMTGNMTGSAIKRLVLKTIRKAEIELPPLNEQRRIADKLDTTLAAVEACKQKLNNAAKTIQRFRQSVLAAAVSGELTREWREERGIEGEWEMTTLSKLVQRIDAGLNLKCDERIPQHEERGLIKISAVTWGKFNEEESKTLPASAEIKEENRIKPGDLLISRANTIELVGSCVIVESITKNLYLPDKVLRLEADEKLKKWLLIYLRSPGGRSQIESLSSGNQLSMRNLSQKNMLSIKLPLPTQEELDQIYRKSGALFDQADILEEQIQSALSAASRLTPSLLAKAFRGELVPQDPNDEPASVLLERIKAQREAEAAAKKPAKRGRKKKADPAQLAIPAGIADNHLAKVLEECGALSERALLAASELEPAVFQLQLSKELKAGALKQVAVDGEAAYADAAWEEEE